MPLNEDFNPLAFLPDLGQTKQVPGGIMYCKEYSIKNNPITFSSMTNPVYFHGDMTIEMTIVCHISQEGLAKVTAKKKEINHQEELRSLKTE